jgi:HK97 gp10 family phage protein
MAAKLSWGQSVRAFNTLVASTSKNVQKDVEKAVDKTGDVVYGEAKRLTPRRTGRLDNGWRKSRRGRGKNRRVNVFNNVPYGPFVEFGTSRMAPRHMLRNAQAKGNRFLSKELRKINRKTSNQFNN